MSGWNASRPTWDPEGGVSDSTPGFPDQEDSRPGNGRHSYGQSGQQGQPRQPSFPGYDPEDLWPQDKGEGGYSNGAGGQHASSGQHRYGTRASLGLSQEDYPAADYGQPSQQFEQFEQRDYPQPGHTGRHAAGTGRSTADQEYATQDYAARMDPALQDFFAPQPSRPGTAPSGRQPAPTPQAPQAPQPSPAPGAPGPGYQGQPGYPGQGPQPGGRQSAPQRDGQPRRPTGPQQRFQASHGTQPSQAPWASQPSQSRSAPPWASEPGQAGHADPWDTPAPRPGSRSASHADRDRGTRGSQRGRGKVFIAVGLVVVLAIAAGAYLVLRKHGTTPPASLSPTTAPRTTPSASHPASGQASQPATGTAYTLSTPATAGGYAKLATASSTVTSTATATAQSVREQAVNSGGKVTTPVSGYYQLSSGQVMSFAGYEGTFNPAKVLASLGQVGQGGQTYPAGAHGGDLACIPSAGTPGGTVCVWVTTTTLGVTEFFASTGAPENVTDQPKAAQDTVNFRADTEAAKS